MAVCGKMNFLMLLFLLAIALTGCTQQGAGNGVASSEDELTNINETGNAQPIEEQTDAASGNQNTSDSGSPPASQSNASEQEGALGLNTTNEEQANETSREPLLISIVSFSSDKPTYGSSEQMVFSVVLNSSGPAENAVINIFGIKPYRYAYINDTKLVALESGINIINFTETAPYCTAGCGGVYPGPYEIHANIFVGDVLVANATTTITLVSESNAKASDFI
jgi:hypothetical protein